MNSPGLKMLEPPQFAIHLTTVADGLVRVEITGDVDLVTAPALGRVLRNQISEGRSLVLDFSRTTFMDSSGVKVLIDAVKWSRSRDLRLVVAPEPPHQVHRLFEITGVESVLHAEDAGLHAHPPVGG